MDAPVAFGYWVRRRRKALDLTQDDLARRVGCAQVTIQKIEASEGTCQIAIDGEIVELEPPLTFRSVPKALWVVAPPATDGSAT